MIYRVFLMIAAIVKHIMLAKCWHGLDIKQTNRRVHKMTKSQIFQTLLDQYDEIERMKGFLLFIKDWDGEMGKREIAHERKLAQQYAVLESARLLLSKRMYNSFYSSYKTVTQTCWYARRKYNYDGKPLTDSQIRTRDWANARDAKRAA